MIKLWLGIFIGVVIIHLLCCFAKNPNSRKITKPFLMPLLVLVYVSMTKDYNMLIIGGLLFGFLGDIFLLWDHKSRFFAFGLISFLIGHILYIVAVINKIQTVKIIPMLLLCIIYGLMYYFIFSSIKKNLGKMKIPALIYGLVLLTLNLLAFYNLCLIPTYQNILLFLGTVMFCISDYTLSRNTFVKKIKYGHFYIMLTYIGAQFLIVLGMAL
ncbi:MAG: lysoplasmalogenase [Cellulosilyticaceae bacterium]